MPFVNQLEPESLVRQFMAHPPDGFTAEVSVGGVPTFATRFDLLTTAEPALQSRLRAWPWYRHWSRWLRPRTRFIGSTVCEYATFPNGADPAALARELTTAHADSQPFLIIKDLPQASPLLDATANVWNDAFASACADQGFVVMEGQALAWVPIDFDNTDDYLARLSRGARRNIRRKLRSGDALQIECLRTGSAAFADGASVADFYQLYDNVYAQSEIHFDRIDAEFFRAVLQDADSGGTVFVYKHDGRMIGWNLCFEHASMLVDKYVGFVYPDARDFNLYAVSWMHNLEYARQRGLRFYVAGWTDPEVKAHLGARMTFTRHAVRPRSRLLRFALRHVAHHFESDRSWFEEREHATDRA